jgi:CBS domain-containing protein
MKVQSIMSPDCKYLDQDAAVIDAARLMANEGFGSVPITDGSKLIGMLTDRDIVVRGVAKGVDLDTARVSELMSDTIYYVYADENVDDVAENMAEMQVRRMPVVDRDKKLVGIVSLGDISTKGAKKPAADALKEISKPCEGSRVPPEQGHAPH